MSVVATRPGRIGHLRLNRPRTLNALDLDMIRSIAETLDSWRLDPAVHAVAIEGTGDRAFCAGGDIRAVRSAALAGDTGFVTSFFTEEYRLNAAIAAYPKPFVAVIDGFCMGGGVGVSVHGTIRVATEAAQFAMPETAIGFFPDVGTTYVLPRLPGRIGLYLGLTGARLSGADAVHAGLATHFVPRDRLDPLRRALAEDGVATVAAHAAELPTFSLDPHRATIDRCFGEGSIEAILQALAADGGEFARETADTLGRMSPSALRWSLDIIRAGAGRTLQECLMAELALVHRVSVHPDFAEGVRAMVVDKDRNPKWSAATPA